MRDCAPPIDINHPRCGLSKFLEKKNKDGKRNKLLSFCRHRECFKDFNNFIAQDKAEKYNSFAVILALFSPLNKRKM